MIPVVNLIKIVSEYEAKRSLKIEPAVAENRNENIAITKRSCSNSSSDESGCFPFQLLEAASSPNKLDSREMFFQENIFQIERSQIERSNCESFMEMLMDTGNQLVTHLYAL